MWADKRPGSKVVCLFIRCINKHGWWMNKQIEKKEENDEQANKQNH